MTIFIWAAYDGTLIAGPFKGHTNRVTSVTFSPDSAHIVSGSDDHIVSIWNPRNTAVSMRPYVGHTKGVKSVAFSPNESRVISGSEDRTIRLWDLASGAVTPIQVDSSPSSVVFSSDGLCIAMTFNTSQRNTTIMVWNIRDRTFTTQIKVEIGDTRILELSSDGCLLLYTETKRDENGYHIWRTHKDDPSFTMSPDGWILDDQQCPQLWVPTEIRGTFPGRSGVTVSDGDILQFADFADMLVGDEWSKCYIGD
ncbi:WD40-repeat-containing domain protein [Rhizoctonia solani]|nr:WD40-repeat-containing domain protein [Rhizoctonia solani]